MTMLFKAASYLKAASLSVALVVLLASPAFGQQSNVNLDYNPQKGTEGLTPFSARVNSPEVHDDRTVTFRIDAPNANSVVLPTGAIYTANDLGNEPLAFERNDDGVW